MKRYKSVDDLYRSDGYHLFENKLFRLIKYESLEFPVQVSFKASFYVIIFKWIMEDNGGRKCEILMKRPNELISWEETEQKQNGFVLLFDKDCLKGHCLSEVLQRNKRIEQKTLDLSCSEIAILEDLHEKILFENSSNEDEHSRKIILSYLYSIFLYMKRFCKRNLLLRTE